MKKLLLLSVLFIAISCSKDESHQQECGRITARGWQANTGRYFFVNGKQVWVADDIYVKYKLGDQYCY